MPDTSEARTLESTRRRADFTLLYPCYLPNTERLTQGSVVGEVGRQRSELVFDGAFEMTIRQAQVPPPFTPDPTGASRITLRLFENTPAILIERNDGTRQALYHLYWERDGRFYELQAYGPPLQREIILRVARSLQ